MKKANITNECGQCGHSASMLVFVYFLFLMTGIPLLLAENLSLVGCYEGNGAASHSYGSVIDPFSWEVCVNLCVMKMTIFSGMSRYSQECFCVNDISEFLTATENRQCDPCQEDFTRYCGGPSTVSVYKLAIQDTNPTGLLIATENGVNITMLGDTIHSKTLIPFRDGASYVDYHYDNQEIYFASRNKIFKSVYVSQRSKFSNPALFVDMNYGISGLSIDWIRGFIFFSSDGDVYKAVLGPHMYDISMLGSSNFYLIPRMSMTMVDSFIYHWSYLVKGWYSRTIEAYLYFDLADEGDKIAVDLNQGKMYYIKSESGEMKVIQADFYAGQTVVSHELVGKSMFFHSQLASIDVRNKTVVWVTIERETSYTLYKAEITETGITNLMVLWTGAHYINAKIYHSEGQLPNRGYLCEKKKCSHNCSLANRAARCECPGDMNLGPDNRSCYPSKLVSDPRPTKNLDKHLIILYSAVISCFILFFIVVSLLIRVNSKQKEIKRNYVCYYNNQTSSP